jgi:hypothetical protein
MKRVWPVLLLCLAGTSYGQQTVRIPIIVNGGSEGAIPVLKVEVDHEPAPMTSVTALAGQHLQYVLMNDGTVNSQWSGGIKQQTDIADRLLKELVSGSDTGSLINFTEEINIDVVNQKNPQQLSARLERNGKGIGVGLYDSVISTAKWLSKQPVQFDSRRVIFLVCNGTDTVSTHRLAQAIETLQRAAIPVFVIAPATTGSNTQGDNLRKLARETGGAAYFVTQDAKQALDSIQNDLTHSFLLQVSVPSSKKMVPLGVSDVASQLTIVAAPQIGAQ